MLTGTLSKKYFIPLDLTAYLLGNIGMQGINFLTQLMLIRVLSPADYGLYGLAYNIIGFMLLVNGFGVVSSLLQYLSKAPQNERYDASYFSFAFKVGHVANLIIGSCTFFIIYFLPLNKEVKELVVMLSLLPLGKLNIDLKLSYFRAREKNLSYMHFALISSAIIAFFSILGAKWQGLSGYIFWNYFAYILIIIYLIRTSPALNPSFVLRNLEKKYFLQFGFFSMITDAFSQLTYWFDLLVVGIALNSFALFAEYKVALYFPQSLLVIPGLLAGFKYPDWVKNASNLKICYDSYYRLLLYVIGIITVISVFANYYAETLINILFGSSYKNIIVPFHILMTVFLLVASIRIINGNMLAALGKIRFNFWVSLIGLISQTILVYPLTIKFHMMGGILSLVLVILITTLITTLKIRKIFYAL